MIQNKIISQNNNSTVVEDYKIKPNKQGSFQSEKELEKKFIELLKGNGYEYITINNEADLIKNLRKQIEKLNNFKFTDNEWGVFFKKQIANDGERVKEKTKKIQEGDGQLLLTLDNPIDGLNYKNIKIIDKNNIHNNILQIINQYEVQGKHKNRYDVTILVNGIPLVHIELKKRGIAIKEAFNQINRYQKESFWSGCGLYNYIQIFVISNGTRTKYYSNTIREGHLTSNKNKTQTSNSFEFTSWWADSKNKIINDLDDFTKTFFARHTILNILIKYCVFTVDENLLVLRPYQIAAVEKIINKVLIVNSNPSKKWLGTVNAGGYIWHTTGSGKTLTSFKTARILSKDPNIDKVLFIVDRQDLDYQTMKEYDKYEKGAANSTKNTKQLEERLSSDKPNDKISITTIQKLNVFISKNFSHTAYDKKIVLIFDECHRSQFGEFHKNITKKFKNYIIFGFTGTPIFVKNSNKMNDVNLQTTEQAFGEMLHSYTIVDAIHDENVLPFRVEYINTLKTNKQIEDAKIYGIETEAALEANERIKLVSQYILEHFNQKTRRNEIYKHNDEKVNGFNSIFCTASISAAKKYYLELNKQNDKRDLDKKLKIATIFSYCVNESEDLSQIDEEMDTNNLDSSSRDFLENAIKDYNKMFKENYSTDGEGFNNYYKDISRRIKSKELDLLIVVNMFLTGFDATTLNTLWVDKNLRLHGLLQAYSRTNRILNSVKTFGNIVCFRNLESNTNEAIALFGNKDAYGIVILKTYLEYINGYEQNNKRIHGYKELCDTLKADYDPVSSSKWDEEKEKKFIKLYGSLLKLKNILVCFDDFGTKKEDRQYENQILLDREFQDFQSIYLDLWEKYKKKSNSEKENINDDIVFEIELMKQVEIDIHYILRQVEEYRTKNCKDIELKIEREILSTPSLRNKKELIENFISRMNVDIKYEISDDIEKNWDRYIKEERDIELTKITANKSLGLNEKETKKYMAKCFDRGEIIEHGSEITDIFKKPRPWNSGNEEKKKAIEELTNFFEKYYDISNSKII